MKKQQTIIIEVKTSDSAKRYKNRLGQLAQYAKEMPGVRFDLVITTPPRKSRTSLKPIREELRSLKHSLITEINRALSQNDTAAAVSFISILLEGFLLRIAEENRIHIKHNQKSLSYLAKTLRDNDIISPSVLQLAEQLSQRRDSIAHTSLIPTSKAYDLYHQLLSFLRQNDRDMFIQPEIQQYFPIELTTKELEVLYLMSEGKTNTEMAESLNIDIRTVEYHINNMYNKLKSTSSSEVPFLDSTLDNKWGRLRDFIKSL